MVLITVPPVCCRTTEPLKPLLGEVDISKTDGTLAVMLSMRLLPEIVNCSVCGLAEALPAQATIVPVTGPVLITGAVTDGFTVMVKVAGAPGQPFDGTIKLPNEIGVAPTGIVETTLLVAVLITETLLSF